MFRQHTGGIDAAVPVYSYHPTEDETKLKALGALDPYDKCLGPYKTEGDLLKALELHPKELGIQSTWEPD